MGSLREAPEAAPAPHLAHARGSGQSEVGPRPPRPGRPGQAPIPPPTKLNYSLDTETSSLNQSLKLSEVELQSLIQSLKSEARAPLNICAQHAPQVRTSKTEIKRVETSPKCPQKRESIATKSVWGSEFVLLEHGSVAWVREDQ